MAPFSPQLRLCGYFFFFFAGTLPPSFRACESPIVMACLWLFTLLPERPLFSFPFFISCIVFSTFSDAFFPYLAISLSPIYSASQQEAYKKRASQSVHY